MQKTITYEQPLNERIRSFLRLEFLFQQMDAYLEGRSVWDSRAALTCLLEILAVFSRADLKTEVIKELERQITVLERLEQNPSVDSERLGSTLDELDALIDQLYTLKGQIGQELRSNEFLSSIRQRQSIPGGTCDFDLPAYHFWLQQPVAVRLHHLKQWFSCFKIIHHAITCILRLIRESGVPTQERAEGGFLHKTLDASQPCHLVRLTLAGDSPYFPEISGGKHRFTVRFLAQRLEERPLQTPDDVEFELTCCVI